MKTKKKMKRKSGCMKIKKMLCMFALLAVALSFVTQAFTLPVSHGVVEDIFPGVPGPWLPFAFVVVLLVIAVAAFVFLISGIVDSPRARNWSRMQIYQALLSAFVLVIFVSTFYLFNLDPRYALNSFGMLPTWGSGPADCYHPSYMSVYQLATCDMSLFNSNTYSYFNVFFGVAMFMGLQSGMQITFSPFNGSFGGNIKPTISVSVPSFIPFDIEGPLGAIYIGLFTMSLVNQLQLILLAGSMLFLVFFVTVGLIARTFGFSRTFGGALIALGLGLGIVYPLITAITYGFINVRTGIVDISALSQQFLVLIGYLVTFTLGQGIPSSLWLYQFISSLAGLTFIPFLNFTIVDTFIVDFSKAIGERLDFLSMLTGLV